MVAVGSCSILSLRLHFLRHSTFNFGVDFGICFALLLVISDYSSPIIGHLASGSACPALAHYTFHVHYMNLRVVPVEGGK
jgi:hypothetical protein